MDYFYEHRNPDTNLLQGWHRRPDGSLHYVGKVEEGFANGMVIAYSLTCRRACAVYGVPSGRA